MHRVFAVPFADIYPHYVTKVEKKGRSTEELTTVITWLTGYSESEIDAHIASKTTLQDFYGQARMNANAPLITGSICGVKIQEIDDPLMQQIRYLDKLVDELAKGRPLDKILRN